MEHMWNRFALFLALVCVVVVQPALYVRAAAQYRVMIPAVATRPTPAPTPTPTPTPTPRPTPTPTPPAAPADRYTALERETVDKINARRRAAGCGGVTLNAQLTTAAERHSRDMATNNFFSHTGSDGSTFDQRIRAAGYTPSQKIGEILAAGYTTADAVVQGWYDSPGHKAIMLDCQYREIGISLEIKDGTQYRYYWTATFGLK
jgi:uncharacterized protein YkwD